MKCSNANPVTYSNGYQQRTEPRAQQLKAPAVAETESGMSGKASRESLGVALHDEDAVLHPAAAVPRP